MSLEEFFDRYPVGTVFQKKPSGHIVALLPDGRTVVAWRQPYKHTAGEPLDPRRDEEPIANNE